jgi:hypothetical protein
VIRLKRNRKIKILGGKKMEAKKALSLVLAIVMAMALLTGCGGSSKPAAESKESGKKETPLTTVRQSGYDIGNEACKRAFLEIEHPDLPKQTIYFEPELIIRKSSEKYGGAQV